MPPQSTKQRSIAHSSKWPRDADRPEYRIDPTPSPLRERGIELVPADAPSYFTDPSPTAEFVRQILGAVAQFEKAALVAKLRHAREAKRAATGRCEGRPPVPLVLSQKPAGWPACRRRQGSGVRRAPSRPNWPRSAMSAPAIRPAAG